MPPTRRKSAPNRLVLVYAIAGLGNANDLLPADVERTDYLNGLIAAGFIREQTAAGELIEQDGDDSGDEPSS